MLFQIQCKQECEKPAWGKGHLLAIWEEIRYTIHVAQSSIQVSVAQLDRATASEGYVTTLTLEKPKLGAESDNYGG